MRGPWVLVAAFAALLGCKAQSDAFYAKIFTCDRNSAQDPCGTTRDGKPMTCLAASQLGGHDFCAEACDPSHASPDPRFTCLTSGALVQVCHPHASVADHSLGCPSGLQCFRTDLIEDRGICLDMRVCTNDSDCEGDPRRNACAAAIARSLFPQLPGIDHLQCLQASCGSAGSSCLPGESCLANYYELGTVPDICVPNCDANLKCPPTFSCAEATAGAGSPSICLPGVPGARCKVDQDCAVGDCFDTGAGFNECVLPVPCGTNLDCAPLDRPGAPFACVAGSGAAGNRCISLVPLHGANCTEASECPTGQECFRYSPYVPDQGKGECRVPCDGDRRCPARAGVPHVCLEDGAGGCYPGDFAMPCTDSSECLAGFSCLPVSPDARTVITSASICTTTCASDADCQSHPMVLTGFCKEGVCRLSGRRTDPCDRDEQCREGACLLDAAGQGRCTK